MLKRGCFNVLFLLGGGGGSDVVIQQQTTTRSCLYNSITGPEFNHSPAAAIHQWSTLCPPRHANPITLLLVMQHLNISDPDHYLDH